MTIKLKYAFFLPSLISLHLACLAQINIHGVGSSPQQLLQNYFLGSGIQISNVTFQGDIKQIGAFSGGQNTLLMDSGLVISTDQVDLLQTNYNGGAQTTFSTQSESRLLSLANQVPALIGQSFPVTSVNDVALLSFDFVPNSDSVSFSFVFGTDEYMEWVNTPFNDVFAFFISGPGIVGPFSGADNMAFIPGTSPHLPITVSSVNANLNNAYYVHNIPNQQVDLDGYTTKIQASSKVQCGETYHLTLAIADGSDQMLESSVFFEANSFSTYKIQGQDSVHVCLGDSTLISLSPPTNSASIEWYDNNTGSGSPLHIGQNMMYSGVLSDTLYAFYSYGACRSSEAYPVYTFVDSVHAQMYLLKDTFCVGDIPLLEITTDSSVTLDWYASQDVTADYLSSGFVYQAPAQEHQIYYVRARKGDCVGPIIPFDIWEVEPVFTTQMILPTCYDSQNGMIAVVSDSLTDSYTYLWSTGDTLPNIQSLNSGSYTLTVIDVFGCSKTEVYVLNQAKVADIQIVSNDFACQDSLFLISASSSQSLQYRWQGDVYNDTLILFLDQSQYLLLSVLDSVGCNYRDSVWIEVFDCSEKTTLPSQQDSEISAETAAWQIPNVFTPNHDGQNDVFYIPNLPQDYYYIIYNRWGQEVFTSSVQRSSWNGQNSKGQQAPSGTYYVLVKSLENTQEEFSQYITLLK